MNDFGILSIVPALLAIFLAFKTKDVILSLFTSVIVGALIVSKGNPYIALVDLWKKYIFSQLTSPWAAELIILMTVIGGFVAILEASGGLEALTKKMSTVIGSRVKVQLAAWFGGLCIFFSDSANCLILGPVFRPVADRFNISREKLAYIVDSTASPVCMLVPITSWAVLIGGFIEVSLKEHGITIDAFNAYLSTLPYQFYTVLAVFMVPLVALSKKEFGPMVEFETKAINRKSVVEETVSDLEKEVESRRSYVSVALIPFLVLAVVLIGMFMSFGFPNMGSDKFRISMASAYFLATLSCILMIVIKKIMTLSEAISTVIDGCKNITPVLIMLIAAFGLSTISGELGTAKYLARVTLPYIPSSMLAALVFLIAVIISFATGSANGTQALVIPLAIPLALHANAPLIPVVAAAAAGGLFGDHCSPISDTTILSSMGSGCNTVDHAKSQLPYALVAATASFFTFLLSGFTQNALILMPVAIALMLVFFYLANSLFGKEIVREEAE